MYTTGRVSNPPLPSHGLVTLQYYDVESLAPPEKLRYPVRDLGTSNRFRLSFGPQLQLDDTLTNVAPANHEPHWQSNEVGVVELHAG